MKYQSSLRSLLGVALLIPALNLHAVDLSPGTSVTPVDEGPVSGSILWSGTSPFSTLNSSGTVTSTVLANDTSNPFAGGLTFTYQIEVDPISVDAITRFTVSSFADFMTDVSYTTSYSFLGPGIAPVSADRSALGGGAVVGFDFQGGSGLPPSSSSELLVVQTDAVAYNFTMASVTDASTSVASVTSVAPLVVPEPTSMSLLLLGLSGLFVRTFRRTTS